MNKVLLFGRLTADPEVKTISSNSGNGDFAVLDFKLAVDRAKKTGADSVTDFISCHCIGHPANFIGKYAHKGTQLAIEGAYHVDSFEKDGVKRYKDFVEVYRVEIGAGSKASPIDSETGKGNKPQTSGSTDAPDTVNPDDDELPF